MGRVLGLVAIWLLGTVSGTAFAMAVDVYLRASNYGGYPPLLVALGLFTGLPCIFIWQAIR
jgi:hypothetical protein